MKKEDEFELQLASFDFSGDSRVRVSLRARLLSSEKSGPALAPLALAFAAAVAALVLLPTRAPKKTAFPIGPNGLPVMTGTLPVREAKTEPIFESVQGSPFETKPVTLDEIFVRKAL